MVLYEGFIPVIILPNLSGSAAPEMLTRLGWTLRYGVDVPRTPPTVLAANDRLHEARTVMRLTSEHLRRHPEQTVAVVVRVPETYRTDFTLAAREQQLPVTFCMPQTGAQTPAGRLLLLIARVLLSHWDYEDVCALLAHPELPELSSSQWTHIRELGPRAQRGWSGLLPPELRSLEQLQERGTPATWSAVLQPLTRTWPDLAALLSAATLPVSGDQRDLGAALIYALQQPLKEQESYAPGQVFVAPPEAMCGARADFVCVVGLSEGVWPGVPQFPPVLDAHDRAALQSAGWKLPTTGTHAAREEALYWWSGHAAPEATVLYPHFVDGRPRPASGLISVEAESAASAPPAVWPAVPPVRAENPPPFPEPAFDVLELPLSATQLTRFGQCAFHWFAQHGLGLKEREEPTASLAPHVRGRLYHHTLDLVAKQLAQTPDSPLDDLLEQSFAVAEAAEHAARLPNWDWQRQDHLHHLHGLIRSPDFLPDGFRIHQSELSFTTEWCGLTVTGQIDRLDVQGEGEDLRYAVTDYKSGSSKPKGALGAGGQLSLDVQLPIYLAAAGEYTGTAVTSGRYLSITRREKRVLAEAAPDVAGLEELAAAFEDAAESGFFPVNPDEQQEACTFCPYMPLCRRANNQEEHEL